MEAANVRIVVFCVITVTALIALLASSPIGIYYRKYATSRIALKSVEGRTYDRIIKPTAQWVHAFYTREGRLPTQDEVNTFARSNADLADVAVGIFTTPPWVKPPYRIGMDFVVWTDVGDWNLYYNSWDRKQWKEWTD